MQQVRKADLESRLLVISWFSVNKRHSYLVNNFFTGKFFLVVSDSRVILPTIVTANAHAVLIMCHALF